MLCFHATQLQTVYLMALKLEVANVDAVIAIFLKTRAGDRCFLDWFILRGALLFAFSLEGHSEQLPVEEGVFPWFRYTPFVLPTPELNELCFHTVLCPARQRDPPLSFHIVFFIVSKVAPLLRKIGHGVRIQPPEPPGASRAISCHSQVIPGDKSPRVAEPNGAGKQSQAS
ncbi:hypothetical protein NDU88_002884 [Pleurodeles waltl]|uniref:Uncharacterized protein n=1 Tax=Pleurodeles waltl TaxID=8319 RepID=A0AAV7MWZ4_PLEWA|nr:hypothetical protein NDU88_002884 [Pleurodeles waltl]